MEKPYKDKDTLEKAYKQFGSLNKTAEYFGVSKKLILNHMKKYNIERNKRVKKPRPEKVDTYHKGYIKTWNGYIKVKAPQDHPYKDKKGYIMEHRLVIERQIGKYLEPNQEVHHLDGDKTNNKIENLIVLSKAEHRRIHLIDSIHKPRYSLN